MKSKLICALKEHCGVTVERSKTYLSFPLKARHKEVTVQNRGEEYCGLQAKVPVELEY